MLNYLIVCPLVFIAGYVDAIAGGGGLITLPAYMITGLPTVNCLATNKMTNSMGTAITTFKFAKGKMIPWKLALFSIPCAFLGSTAGANIALIIDNHVFKIMMLFILPVTGIYVMTRKKIEPKKEAFPFAKTVPVCMTIAFVIGMYDGFYGPGTGTFLILLLTGLARMGLQKANGLTKAINFSTNVAALTVYLIHGEVLFPMGLIAGAFNVAGNYLGAGTFQKGGSKVVKPVMILVISIFFVKVLYDLGNF